MPNQQQIYFTSDLHFHHHKICGFTNRPYYSTEEMNEALINNWNAVVNEKDIVWNLGDFSFGNIKDTESVLRRLNGQHNMVLGNHDGIIVSNKARLLQGKLLNSIQDYKEIKVEDHKIVLCHYSFRVWNKSHSGSWHCYGHSHGTLPPHGLSLDVGVDCKEITSEYRPISFDELKSFMFKRSVSVIDQHGSK